jgi:hypothetical protein
MEGRNDAEAGTSRGGSTEDPSCGGARLLTGDAGTRRARLDTRRRRAVGANRTEALAAATAEYRPLNLSARYDELAVCGEVNRMIAAAINVNPEWFWHGPDG